MSSSGQMHTGQPGPGTSSTFDGIALRRPAVVIDRSWPPQTFMTLMFAGSGSARMRSSHSAPVVMALPPGCGGLAQRRGLAPQPRKPRHEAFAAAPGQLDHLAGVTDLAQR